MEHIVGVTSTCVPAGAVALSMTNAHHAHLTSLQVASVPSCFLQRFLLLCGWPAADTAAVRAALERAVIPVRSRGDGALLRRPEVMELIDTWHGDQPLSDVLADATTELPDSLDNAHLSEERRAMLQAFLDIARGHLELERRATVDDFLSNRT